MSKLSLGVQKAAEAGTAMPLESIRVGKRYRQHMGDIPALAASIAEHGLLHPVVVTPERLLVAGERRLAAVRELGWTSVPVTIVTPADLLRAENDENAKRLNFSPTEAVEIGEALLPAAATAARERQRAGGGIPGSGKLPQPERKTRDSVAAAVGMSGRTFEKAVAVVAAADADPEMGDLVEQMDRTGKVDAAYRELKRRENRAAVAASPIVTAHVAGQRYQTIVLDPPWSPEDEGDVDQIGRAQPTYATMPIAAIEALPVGDDAADNCHIYVWITNRSLPKGFALLKAWGFRYVTTLTWCKPSIGVGNYFRNNTEHVLFGVRGSLPLTVQDIGTWFEAPRGPDGHSSKPDAFYELVRRASPGPRAEWFGRQERDGFVQRLPAIET
jgi:N6-adenosine-specific RNA methylase IME4